MAGILRYLATETSLGRRLTDGLLRMKDSSTTKSFEDAPQRRPRSSRSTPRSSNSPLSRQSTGARSSSPCFDGPPYPFGYIESRDVEISKSFADRWPSPGK